MLFCLTRLSHSPFHCAPHLSMNRVADSHVALNREDDDNPDGDVAGEVANGAAVGVEGVGGVAQAREPAVDERESEAEDEVDAVGEGQHQQVHIGGGAHGRLHQHQHVEDVA